MNKTVLALLALLTGAGGGFAGGYFLAKKKYESLADDEVKSVKESLTKYYESHHDNSMDKPQNDKSVVKSEELHSRTSLGNEKSSLENKKNFVDYSAPYRTETNEIPSNKRGISNDEDPNIYIISPEDYRESEYDSKTLVYYTDRVLADDDYNPIDNYEDLIGRFALTDFGHYEDDCVYVRNDILKIDYEILLDNRAYSKIAPKYRTPHPEDE